LAVVRRAASQFELHTEQGVGTVVLAIVDLSGDQGASAPQARDGRLEAQRSDVRGWAGVSVGLGEANGDGWAVAELSDGLAVAVVDGLGHGPLASAAADPAMVAALLHRDSTREHDDATIVTVRRLDTP